MPNEIFLNQPLLAQNDSALKSEKVKKTAAAAIRNGGNFQTVIAMYNITDAETLAYVKNTATHIVGYQQVVNEAQDPYEVAHKLGLDDEESIQYLVKEAAAAAVRKGTTLKIVIPKYKVTNPTTLSFIKSTAQRDTGAMAVMDGQDPYEVARKLGLDDEESIQYLVKEAARTATSKGENFQTVIAQYNITDPETVAYVKNAATHIAGYRQVVEENQDPYEVARKLGLDDEESIQYLVEEAARAAARKPTYFQSVIGRDKGRDATSLSFKAKVMAAYRQIVNEGQDPYEVARKLGIDDEKDIQYLVKEAADAAITKGMNLQTVIAQYKVTDAKTLTYLKNAATYTFGYQQVVNEGQDPYEVARKLGIDDEKGIQYLVKEAADTAIRKGMNLQTAIAQYKITEPKTLSYLENVVFQVTEKDRADNKSHRPTIH